MMKADGTPLLAANLDDAREQLIAVHRDLHSARVALAADPMSHVLDRRVHGLEVAVRSWTTEVQAWEARGIKFEKVAKDTWVGEDGLVVGVDRRYMGRKSGRPMVDTTYTARRGGVAVAEAGTMAGLKERLVALGMVSS